MKSRFILTLLAVLSVPAFFAVAATAPSVASAKTGPTSATEARPNVIFILTDDLDRQSFNARTMPRTFSYLKDRGTTFRNQLIPMPTCCPSRAASFSGQYNHNNGVLSNGGRYGGYDSYYRNSRDLGIGLGYNLGTFMQRGGYRTALVGKYMNRYGDGYLPGVAGSAGEDIPGWDKWFVPIQGRSQKYYNYRIRFNEPPDDFRPGISLSRPRELTADVTVDRAARVAVYAAPRCGIPGGCGEDVRRRQHQNFSERIFVNQVIGFLEDGEGAGGHTGVPSFVWYATDTPHGTVDNTLYRHRARTWSGPEYSPLDRSRFRDFRLPMLGAFNEYDVRDKPRYVRDAPPFDRAMIDRITRHNRARWRSLYSLDRELGRLYDYLKSSGQADRTVVVFTSDNGYMSGQHRLPQGKLVPYRESTEFPIIYRGPGIAAGRTVGGLVANFDLAPTILSLAGLSGTVVADPKTGRRAPFDGVSLKSSMTPGRAYVEPPDRAILLESVVEGTAGKRTRPYKGVRTSRYVFIRYYRPGFESLFDCPAGRLSGCVSGRAELYDLQRDPDQRNNLMVGIRRFSGNPAWARGHGRLLRAHAELQQALNRLEHCSGASCLR